ncbi:polysaccharide export protein [Thalassotalea sp. LPB0316]|uniref:polysaccharide biosynthesis/export family protein n=1 Tax=Thalassotalea sp. LPB0316 TaxID=2769490 RepID=UPI0018685451|nr:polysaccharide biosynthesis/export family protein [Thalassotalea sp. LPB0316]QOL26154.1 polysaccharide export protein [Thalassotalea sp. LPB0316]
MLRYSYLLIYILFAILPIGKANALNYVLSAGDSVLIEVYDEPDLRTRAKIDKSGVISFPFLDDVQVSGKTTEEIEMIIDAGLRGDYLIDPQVSVSIVAYRPFFIHGQVKVPGGYPYQPDLTLDKALALAGGLTNRASKSDWQITRKVNGTSKIINADISTEIQPDDIVKIGQSFF